MWVTLGICLCVLPRTETPRFFTLFFPRLSSKMVSILLMYCTIERGTQTGTVVSQLFYTMIKGNSDMPTTWYTIRLDFRLFFPNKFSHSSIKLSSMKKLIVVLQSWVQPRNNLMQEVQTYLSEDTQSPAIWGGQLITTLGKTKNVLTKIVELLWSTKYIDIIMSIPFSLSWTFVKKLVS